MPPSYPDFGEANFASQQRVPQTEAREVGIHASDDEEAEVYLDF